MPSSRSSEPIVAHTILFTVAMIWAAASPLEAGKMVPKLFTDIFSGGYDVVGPAHLASLALSRAYGFFTWINVIRTVAIGGMSVAVIPIVFSFAGPIGEIIYALRYVLEVAAYVFNFVLIAHGFSSKAAENMYGSNAYYAAYLGVAFSVPLFFVSRMLRQMGRDVVLIDAIDMTKDNSKGDSKDESPLNTQFNMLLLVWSTTASIALGSTQLGYVSASTFFGLVGFTTFSTCGAFHVGFSGEEQAVRAQATALLMLAAFWASALAGEEVIPRCLADPYSVFASIVYFLVALIKSSFFFSGNYSANQASFLLSVAVASYVGNVFSLGGISNTSLVFFGLYIVEKAAELASMTESFATILFMVCASIYGMATYINKNPGVIVGMFNVDDV